MLVDRCVGDTRYVIPICNEAWYTALFVLLREESWTVGVESEIIEFIQVLIDQYYHLPLPSAYISFILILIEGLLSGTFW
jgi:hypothetical protein